LWFPFYDLGLEQLVGLVSLQLGCKDAVGTAGTVVMLQMGAGRSWLCTLEMWFAAPSAFDCWQSKEITMPLAQQFIQQRTTYLHRGMGTPFLKECLHGYCHMFL